MMNISSELVYLNNTKSNVYHIAHLMARKQNIVLFGRYCLISLDDYCYLRNIPPFVDGDSGKPLLGFPSRGLLLLVQLGLPESFHDAPG